MLNEQQINTILHATKDQNPRAWEMAHRENHAERYDFIILAIRALWPAGGGAVGGNWRRGVHGDLSMDGISVNIGGEWRFADVIVGAGGSNPSLGYRTPGPEAALRNSSGQYIGEAGVAKPQDLPPVVGTPTPPVDPPVDPPPVDPPPPAVNLQPVLDAIAAMRQQVSVHTSLIQEARHAADTAASRADDARVIAQNTRDRLEDLNKELLAIKSAAENPPTYKGSAGFLGTVTLRPQK
jgi:hypothetical protein